MMKFIKYISVITIALFSLSLVSCNENNHTTGEDATDDVNTSEKQNFHKVNGFIGDYHSYELEEGILTIRNIDDLSYRINYYNEDMPWEEYRDEISEVKFIGRIETIPHMFDYYRNLKTVTSDGGLYYIQSYTFQNCEKLETLQGFEHLYFIGAHAFENCNSLHNLPISNFLTEIDEYAFAGCVKLDNVIMPSSVLKIANHAFSSCYSISTLSLNEGIEEIEDYAFASCISLTEIYFPKTVLVTIKAVSDCKKLTSIYLNSLDGVTYFFEKSKDISEKLLINIKNTIDYIPEGYTEISSTAVAYKCYAKDVK